MSELAEKLAAVTGDDEDEIEAIVKSFRSAKTDKEAAAAARALIRAVRDEDDD